jgi:hypothetical protein
MPVRQKADPWRAGVLQLGHDPSFTLSLQERDEMLRNIRSIEQGAMKLLDYRARQSTLLGSTDGVGRERPARDPGYGGAGELSGPGINTAAHPPVSHHTTHRPRFPPPGPATHSHKMPGTTAPNTRKGSKRKAAGDAKVRLLQIKREFSV